MQKSLTGNSNWKLAVYSGGKETVLGRLGRISLTDKKLKLVALSSGGDIKGQNEQQAGRADSLDKYGISLPNVKGPLLSLGFPMSSTAAKKRIA